MPRGRSAPVNRHWTGLDVATFSLSAGSVALTANPAQHDRETILRTRGLLTAVLDGNQSPPTGVNVSVGLILVPEGTGTTVLWSPFADADAPWFYYTSFYLGYEEMVTDVIDVPGITSYREVIDSKAMRRIRNQEIQFVVENTTVNGAGAVDVIIGGRFLTQE